MSEFNLKSTTVEKGLELVQEFIGKIASPSIEELGLMISDNIKHRRLKNQISNLTKVKKIVEDNGISLKQVNLKVLFPYLEGISVEEDETLQDMWANLFVNYIDVSSNLKLTVYPSILKQLSSDEVTILKKLFHNNNENILKSLISEGDIHKNEVNNLERLGLIQEHRSTSQSGFLGNHLSTVFMGFYKLSNFGKDFIEACTLKEKTNG